MKEILEQIKNRREKQLEKYSPEEDDKLKNGELAYCALCYLGFAHQQSQGKIENDEVLNFWPFPQNPFHPFLFSKDNLIETAALIVAEIERLERKESKEPEKRV